MPITGGYTLEHGPAYAGQVADRQLKNVVSKLNSQGDSIPYGKGVARDGENAAKLPTSSSTADSFVGVAIYELNRAYQDDEVFGAVKDNDFSVLTMGVIWVVAAGAVDADDDVFLRVGSTNTGDFAKEAGSGATASVEIPNAKFLTSAAKAGDLVKISIKVGG